MDDLMVYILIKNYYTDCNRDGDFWDEDELFLTEELAQARCDELHLPTITKANKILAEKHQKAAAKVQAYNDDPGVKHFAMSKPLPDPPAEVTTIKEANDIVWAGTRWNGREWWTYAPIPVRGRLASDTSHKD